MDLTIYIVRGKNPKTNRANTRGIHAFDEDSARKRMEAQGFVEPFEIISQEDVEPATTKQIDYARDLGIPIPMNATLPEMSRRISAAVDSNVDFSAFRPTIGNGWNGWPQRLHNETTQIARQLRAKSAQYMPIELSRAKQAALFAASDGDNVYVTTLEDCHCLDFYRTGKPCKHMYRLAHELGLYDLSLIQEMPVDTKAKINQTLSAVNIPTWLIHVILLFTTWGIGNIIYLVIKARKKKQ